MAITILGINPGTRLLGIAVLRNGDLIDYQVKYFKERWSKEKELHILAYLEKLIDYYGITMVAINSPDPSRSSSQLDHLSDQMKAVAEKKQITVQAYATVTVKLGLEIKGANKNGLMAHIAECYPELRKVYLKEINNQYPYYEKVFEAIALAKWCATDFNCAACSI